MGDSIGSNERITKYITEKYGEFSDSTFKEFIKNDFGMKLSDSACECIKKQIDSLLKFQNLRYEDIQYLGKGQTFSTLGIGQAVLKVGETYSEFSEVLPIPYRLNPIYKEKIVEKDYSDRNSEDIYLYISHRANTDNITEEDTQKFYNMIRKQGGLWVDVKSDNLGRVKTMTNFSSLYGTPTKTQAFDLNFPEYKDNLFLIDYEDVVFLTPGIRRNMIEDYASGDLRGYRVPNITPGLLKSEKSAEEIYYELFISRSSNLLKYEINYQKSINNYALALKYSIYLRESIREAEQRLKDSSYYYKRNRYSVKDIGMKVLNRTNLDRIKRIVPVIKQMLLGNKERATENNSHNQQLDTDPFRTSTDNNEIQI